MQFKKQSRHAAKENIIPLINIVFLLLIFFMITAKITVQDPFSVAPPVSTHLIENDESNDNTLYLSRSGKLAYGHQALTSHTLIAELDPSLFGPKGATLLLKADAQTPMQIVMTLLEQLEQAKVNHIELLTMSSQ